MARNLGRAQPTIESEERPGCTETVKRSPRRADHVYRDLAELPCGKGVEEAWELGWDAGADEDEVDSGQHRPIGGRRASPSGSSRGS